MFDIEVIEFEYRVYYNKGLCFKRSYSEKQALKDFKNLCKKYDDVRVRKVETVIKDIYFLEV